MQPLKLICQLKGNDDDDNDGRAIRRTSISLTLTLTLTKLPVNDGEFIGAKLPRLELILFNWVDLCSCSNSVQFGLQSVCEVILG